MIKQEKSLPFVEGFFIEFFLVILSTIDDNQFSLRCHTVKMKIIK